MILIDDNYINKPIFHVIIEWCGYSVNFQNFWCDNFEFLDEYISYMY